MKVLTTKAEVREVLDDARASGSTVGFFPTMGYLHEGHASGIRRASEDNDVGVVSIFVNPTQFGPTEDLASYPRDLDRDLTVCADAGASVIFAPDVDEMYPPGAPSVAIDVGEIGTLLCGRSRPWHFGGVATVVAKLWNIVGPCRSYFGEKDYQQLTILRRLARALDAPVEVLGIPIVREPDGLAMSSRNVYLSQEDRRAALCLKRALDEGAALIGSGERSGAQVVEAMTAVIAAEPSARLDYAACVDRDTLTDLTEIDGPARLAVAAWIGPARLIDNVRA